MCECVSVPVRACDSYIFDFAGDDAIALSAAEIHWDSDDEDNKEDLLVCPPSRLLCIIISLQL